MKLRKCLRWKVVVKTGKMVRRKRFPAQDTQKLLICSDTDPLKCIRNPAMNPMLIDISKTSTKKFMIGWLCFRLLKFCFCCPIELLIMMFRSFSIFLSFQYASNFFATITNDDKVEMTKSMIVIDKWKELIGFGFSITPVSSWSASRWFK